MSYSVLKLSLSTVIKAHDDDNDDDDDDDDGLRFIISLSYGTDSRILYN